MHEEVPQPHRLRTRAAAEYLGIAPSTMEKLRLTGDGPPFYKVGRTVLYDTSLLDEYLASRRRMSTSEHAEAAKP